MARTLILVGLIGLITACSAQPAATVESDESTPPAATATATATPEPTEEPSPTPEPTPDAAAFGAAYVAIVDAWVVAQCPSQAIIDAAPEDLSAWSEAMAITAPAIAAAASEMRTLDPPEAVEDDLEMLLQAMDERAAAAEAITIASSMDEVYAILDTTFATTAETIGQTGDSIRTALDLPPRTDAPCG
jgi:hypothetical protein